VRYPIGLSLSSQSKTAGGAAPAPERAQAGERGGGTGGAGGAGGASDAGGALLASSDLGVSSAEAIWERFHLKGLGSPSHPHPNTPTLITSSLSP